MADNRLVDDGPSRKSAHAILLDAAVLIETTGRWRPEMKHPDDLTITGAILEARLRGTHPDDDHIDEEDRAWIAITVEVGTRELGLWNRAPGRTADEVAAVCRRAAILVDERKS